VTFRDPDAHAIVGVPLGVPLHPSQLYEAFAEAAIFAVTYLMFQRRHRPGSIIGLYLVLYGAARFVIEFFRFHEQDLQLGLSLTQWLALALAATGAILMLRGARKQQVAS
jgi:phosphatidylglycerol:prolipoprotein diacylglycerol transferase